MLISITMEQGARYLAITNQIPVGLLDVASARSSTAERFNIEGTSTWSPKTGDEIDQAFSMLTNFLISDSAVKALHSDADYFLRGLQQAKERSGRCLYAERLTERGFELGNR